jgi:hypothetical protein
LQADQTAPPILFVDVDGVLSLFGFAPEIAELPGPLHWIDGVAHCIPEAVGPRLIRLAEHFELVWATGWEERANDHLPYLLKLPFRALPTLSFGGRAVFGSAHWKLDAIERYARGRAAAWIDDNVDEECRAWAEARPWPTLIVQTQAPEGLTDAHVSELVAWAEGLRRGPGPR